MATTYSWSYNEDHRPSQANPHGGKRRIEDDEDIDDWSGPGDNEVQAHNNTSHIPDRKRIRTNPAARLYVRGIPRDADEYSVGEFFGCFGKVVEIRLIKDHQTGVNKGYAFVNYHEEKEAHKAKNYCRVGDARIQGCKIFCDFANAHKPREREEPEYESTEDQMRRNGLHWEYRWVTEAELAEFRVKKEKEATAAAAVVAAAPITDSTEAAGINANGGLGLTAYDSDDDDEKEDENDDAGVDRQPPPGPPPKIFGPYPTQTMIEWQDQGFFSTGLVLVRQCDVDDWDEISEIDLSLFP